MFKGGVNQLKKHIAGCNGDVKSCPNFINEEKRAEHRGCHSEKIWEKVRVQAFQRGAMQISNSREPGEPDLTQIGTKYPSVLGTKDGSMDNKNLKQSNLNKEKRKDEKTLVNIM